MDTTRNLLKKIDGQALAFSLLRIAIGWHFFWEGWIKLVHPAWSAQGYLQASWGPLSPVFHAMAASPSLLAISNFLMPCMLFITGLLLMMGLFSRAAFGLAIVLLGIFLVATPPYDFTATAYGWNVLPADVTWKDLSASVDHAQWAGKHLFGTEGSYYLVSKNLIELLALVALSTTQASIQYGVDALLNAISTPSEATDLPDNPVSAP